MPEEVAIAIPILTCGTVVFAIPFLFLAYTRYLRYKETVALAERGLVQPPPRNGGNSGTLRWGVITTAVGIALCLGMWPIGFFVDSFLGLGPWLLPGLLPFFIGLAFISLHYLNPPTHSQPNDDIPPTKMGDQ